MLPPACLTDPTRRFDEYRTKMYGMLGRGMLGEMAEQLGAGECACPWVALSTGTLAHAPCMPALCRRR